MKRGYIFGFCGAVVLIILSVVWQWMNPPEMRIAEIHDTPVRVLGPWVVTKIDPWKQGEKYVYYVDVLRVEIDLESYWKANGNDAAFRFEKDGENWGYTFFTNNDPQTILEYLKDSRDRRLVRVSSIAYEPKAIYDPKNKRR